MDDPFQYGAIAAANSLSDVYAMGGRPITCLNLMAFPDGQLDDAVLREIVAGALSKITEAGAVLAGGHTVADEEPMFGLAVTGLVHPDKIWRNIGARPGDDLVLTKALGTGVLFNAHLKDWVSPAALQACVDSAMTLNNRAAEILHRYEVHAVTDVTGFGLAGHAMEMAGGSGVAFELSLSALPLLPEALEMYERGMRTGMNRMTLQLIEPDLSWQTEVPDWHRQIILDPQTSGGLLVALPAGEGARYVRDCRAVGLDTAAQIGTVVSRSAAGLILLP